MSRKRRYGRGRNERIADYIVNTAAVLCMVFILISAARYAGATEADIKTENVQAMRVPYQTVYDLYNLSVINRMSFIKLLAVYMADNAFFDVKTAPPSVAELEKKYVKGLTRIHNKYGAKNLSPYIKMFDNIFKELTFFPVADFDGINKSYTYVDSFGAVRKDGTHYATDITDRENIPGRLEVFSMGDGTITEIGMSRTDGYYIGVTAKSGNFYYYAHLYGIENNLKKGSKVKAGTPLGTMGNSGTRESESGYSVRLHISISVKSPVKEDNGEKILINPYIFLRFVEK